MESIQGCWKYMIAYDLKCENGHTFEGWFKDANAFNEQLRTNLIACPVCDNATITRIPSTFAIKGAPSQSADPPAQVSPEKMARAIAHYVDKTFDNVGADFANEALKIHYGVNEPRNIRGVSTPQEEETLRKEGVSFVKIPIPVEEPPPESGTDN
ncbi:MAG: DUF1178 family protein [Desulfobacteraceae bacterium]|jgi:hypothetical protein